MLRYAPSGDCASIVLVLPLTESVAVTSMKWCSSRAANVADHGAALRKLIKSEDKDISIFASSRLPVKGGALGRLKLTREFDYPEITWAEDGTSFQIRQCKREFGTILEVEPDWEEDDDYISLTYRLTHTPYMPRIYDVEITLPEKRGVKPKVISALNRNFESSVVLSNQSSLLIGSFTSFKEGADYRLVFITVNISQFNKQNKSEMATPRKPSD